MDDDASRKCWLTHARVPCTILYMCGEKVDNKKRDNTVRYCWLLFSRKALTVRPLGRKLTNQNINLEQRMVIFFVNRPITLKHLENMSMTNLKPNKVMHLSGKRVIF